MYKTLVLQMRQGKVPEDHVVCEARQATAIFMAMLQEKFSVPGLHRSCRLNPRHVVPLFQRDPEGDVLQEPFLARRLLNGFVPARQHNHTPGDIHMVMAQACGDSAQELERELFDFVVDRHFLFLRLDDADELRHEGADPSNCSGPSRLKRHREQLVQKLFQRGAELFVSRPREQQPLHQATRQLRQHALASSPAIDHGREVHGTTDGLMQGQARALHEPEQ
mmetsp:Transcript_110782/g.312332  ORF Transcript_110782/g.312332 Transcript_110782/m.312332 type:complete len:222 (-) Transcript_110782:289-954(-)